jgi:hypothetical protein
VGPPPGWQPAPDQHQHAGEPGFGPPGDPPDRKLPTKLKTAISLSVATVSVVGAFVGWRAHSSGTEASQASRAGQIASVNAASGQSSAEEVARLEERSYLRSKTYQQRLDTAMAVRDKLAPINPAAATAAAHDADVEKQLLQVFAGAYQPSYVTKNGTYDVPARVADILALEPNQADDAKRAFAHNKQLRAKQHDLLQIGLLLALAVGFFTVAGLMRRTLPAVALAAPGWALLSYGFVAFLLVVF